MVGTSCTKSTLVDEAGRRRASDLWTSLYPTGTAAPGYGRLDGGVLPAGVRHGQYEAIVIFGDPTTNYVGRRGPAAKAPGPSGGRTYPAAMLVKELSPAPGGKSWIYRQSPAFVCLTAKPARFDDSLPPMEKSACPVRRPLSL